MTYLRCSLLLTILALSGAAWAEGAKEELSTCPQCNGSGVKVYIDCSSCARSSKPGYNSVGDHYEQCRRCSGQTKLVGAYCELCNRKGKVLLSAIKPSEGGSAPPPKGYKWCGTCGGTGVGDWLQCLQCKRSKYPGYVQMGEGIMACNRCNGKAKTPALTCTTCNGKCIVVDK